MVTDNDASKKWIDGWHTNMLEKQLLHILSHFKEVEIKEIERDEETTLWFTDGAVIILIPTLDGSGNQVVDICCGSMITLPGGRWEEDSYDFSEHKTTRSVWDAAEFALLYKRRCEIDDMFYYIQWEMNKEGVYE